MPRLCSDRRGMYYECVRPASNWNIPPDQSLFLIYRRSTRWVLIHAPRGSSYAAVMDRDANSIAFMSEEDVLADGPHTWRVPPDSALNPSNPIVIASAIFTTRI
jgi:hypothetical protein